MLKYLDFSGGLIFGCQKFRVRKRLRKRRRTFCPAGAAYKGELAHKMFLRTPEATTHVYIHRWGPKATCHDTLEPIRNIGRVPTWAREAPGGRSSRMKF